MVNKIVILAAGKGTRMLELSKNKPKHLINVNKKPYLYYSLKNIKEAGFNEIILVVGYKKEKMEKFAKKYKNEFNLKLVDQFKIIGTKKYGTACPVECVENIINNEDFIVINGDDLYSTKNIKKIKKMDHNFCYIAGFRHKNPEHYGIIKMDKNNFLERIIEKPKPRIDFDNNNPLESLINIGLYKFTPKIFKAVKNIGPSLRNEYEITDAINLLAKEKKVKVLSIDDYWLSFTNPDDVEKIEKFLNKRLANL